MTLSPPTSDPMVAPMTGASVTDTGLVVELRDVTRRFGQVPALSNLSLIVPRGRITVLLGPNGAGKTTAIRVITGALNANSGYVRTFGSDPNLDG